MEDKAGSRGVGTPPSTSTQARAETEANPPASTSELLYGRRRTPMTPMSVGAKNTSSLMYQAMKRRRADLTPTRTTGEYESDLDGGIYINTYGRANLLKKEYIEESERKDDVIELQKTELLQYRQRISVLESEKAAAVAKCMRLEQDKQNKSIADIFFQEQAKAEQNGKMKAAESEANRARDQHSKFMKIVESKDAKISDLEKAIEGHEKMNKSLSEESKRLSEEVSRLNDDMFNLAQSSEHGDEKRRIKTLELQLEVEQTSRKQSEIRLSHALKELTKEREKSSEAERAMLTLEQKMVIESSPAPVAELELHVKQLQKELDSQSTEITKARALKARLESEQVLQEKLSQALARAERAESALASTSESNAENLAGQKELEMWKKAMGSKFGNQNPYEIIKKYDDLEKANLQLAEECGSFKVKSSQALRSKSDVEMNQSMLLEEKEKLKERIGEMKLAALRHERKITLLQKERDGLKRIIASYDEEELSLKPSESGADQHHTLRVKELEEILSQEKTHVSKLESDLQASSKKSEEVLNQNEKLTLKLHEL